LSGFLACLRWPASTPAFTAASRPVAEVIPLPRDLCGAFVQRYGFHGLSYEYIASILPQVAPEIARDASSSLIWGAAPACAL
jgi:acetate kinase